MLKTTLAACAAAAVGSSGFDSRRGEWAARLAEPRLAVLVRTLFLVPDPDGYLGQSGWLPAGS